MKWVAALGLVVVVGTFVLAGPAMADTHAANATNGTGIQPSLGRTQFVVTVYDNGSARWTQRYNQPLSNRTQVQRFQAYADEFNSEETPLYTDFKRRATGLTADGTNATGRSMAARGFTKTAHVESQPTATGVVELSFLWTDFATTHDGRVVVGDAFENGLYLSPDMSIEFRAGPGLSTRWDSVDPNPDGSTNGSGNTSDSLTYFGEAQFATGQPHIAFAANDSLVASAPSSSFGSLVPWVVGAVVAAALVGVVVVRRSGVSVRRPSVRDDDSDAGPSVRDAETTDEPDPSPAADDFRTDEDVVIDLLEANGGRMQQGAIVAETEWSKSKVSTLLSGMEEAGAVTKLRVGRENIVSLAGHEPAAAGSPFDDA